MALSQHRFVLSIIYVLFLLQIKYVFPTDHMCQLKVIKADSGKPIHIPVSKNDVEVYTKDHKFSINLCTSVKRSCYPAACGIIRNFKEYVGKPCEPYSLDPPVHQGRLIVFKLEDTPDTPPTPIPKIPYGTCPQHFSDCSQKWCQSENKHNNETKCTESCAVLVDYKGKGVGTPDNKIAPPVYNKDKGELMYQFPKVFMKSEKSRIALCTHNKNAEESRKQPIMVYLSGRCDPTTKDVCDYDEVCEPCTSGNIYYGRKCQDPGLQPDSICQDTRFSIQNMLQYGHQKVQLLYKYKKLKYKCGTDFPAKSKDSYSGDPAPGYKKQCYCIREDISEGNQIDQLDTLVSNLPFDDCSFNITFLSRHLCDATDSSPKTQDHVLMILAITAGALIFLTVAIWIWYQKIASSEAKRQVFLCQESCCKLSIMFINCLRQDNVKAQYKAKAAARSISSHATEMRARASQFSSKVSEGASMVSRRVSAVSKDVSARFSRSSSTNSATSDVGISSESDHNNIIESSNNMDNGDARKTVKIGNEEYIQLD
jgi:hypothetical protein